MIKETAEGIEVPEVVFSKENDERMAPIIKAVVDLFIEMNPSRQDALGALMLMAVTMLADISDEDARAEATLMCVAVALGNFSFEETTH